MTTAVGVIELKSIAQGVAATDAALKSAGVKLVSAHPACPGKYEIILTGAIADVSAACEHVRARFDETLVDVAVIGRIDPQVTAALSGTQTVAREGSLGVIETYSAACIIKAADLAVKTARVEIFELRVSQGMGGKGIVLITGEVGDVTAAVEVGKDYAVKQGLFAHSAIIPAPHAELWDQL
ncbi:MAG: BMC domain-containing protein [Eubacteriales bacterium]